MKPQDLIRVHQLVDVMGLLRASIPTMPLHHAVTFLHAAAKPGQAVTELSKAMELSLATTSRHVQVLSGAGLRMPGLVACGYGKDGRTKAVLLTDAGRNLIRAVLVALEGGPRSVNAEPPASGSTPQRISWDPFGTDP